MRERPILFSGPMVRAILEGRKTQTRRVASKPVRHPDLGNLYAPGDRLWVRENGWERPALSARDLRDGANTWPPYEYDAEPLMSWEDGELKLLGWRRRPSIHMPRWASRITLEVTGVRVERLQDISEADAKAEGITPCEVRQMWLYGADAEKRAAIYKRAAVGPYRDLWNEINGPNSWDANPWVWVVEFRRIDVSNQPPKIDTSAGCVDGSQESGHD